MTRAVTEANTYFFRESRQRTVDETGARVLFHQHQRSAREDRGRAHRGRRVAARAYDDARTKSPDQRQRKYDRANEFHRGARTFESAMSANSMHVEQLVFVEALRQPLRLESRTRADKQHVDIWTLANHLLAQRYRWKKMPARAASRDYHFHRTAGRRPSASSAPNAAIAMMIEVPP